MKKIGLIAGYGIVPRLVMQSAKMRGVKVYVVAIKEEASEEIEAFADKVTWLSVGELKKAMLFFKLNQVKHITLVGKIHKTHIYNNVPHDEDVENILQNASSFQDDTLLLSVVRTIETYGFSIMDSTHFLKDHMACRGRMTDLSLTDEQREDILFGFSLAKQVAGLDIGQALVVKQKNVIAVEALEGTDQAIVRAGHLVGRGFVVIKVSKPDQDMRFDVPTIGCDTLITMEQAGGAVLAVEAQKTILADKDLVIQTACGKGILLYGYTEGKIL